MQIKQRSEKENTEKLLEKEKEILFFKLDEKDKEIFDLKNKLMELEINFNTTKLNLEELNKNYEYLINNYKNAELINQLQKRIQNLIEEKTIYAETQNLVLNSLTNEIIDLINILGVCVSIINIVCWLNKLESILSYMSFKKSDSNTFVKNN